MFLLLYGCHVTCASPKAKSQMAQKNYFEFSQNTVKLFLNFIHRHLITHANDVIKSSYHLPFALTEIGATPVAASFVMPT